MSKTYLKSNVRIKLTEYLFNTHKFGTDFFIAKTMLEKAFEFPNVTIDEIAFIANTTAPTVSKFCKKIGYQSFAELINDNTKVEHGSIINVFHAGYSVDKSLRTFLNLSNELFNIFFNAFNKEQIERIVKRLGNCRKITIFSGLHGFASAHLFTELMNSFNIPVYELKRDSEISIIKDAIKFSDIVFAISLTGKWATKTFSTNSFEQADLDKIIILNHSDTITLPVSEIVSFSSIDGFYSTAYISSNSLQAFFILLATYLGQNSK
jgi:Transcriptional regulators